MFAISKYIIDTYFSIVMWQKYRDNNCPISWKKVDYNWTGAQISFTIIGWKYLGLIWELQMNEYSIKQNGVQKMKITFM